MESDTVPVTFKSEGSRLSGNLHIPVDHTPGTRVPAIVVTGSWTTVKEQMAGLYAQRLAERGYVALAFDFRHWGASEGNPRQFESPERKIRDIANAAAFLQSRPSVETVLGRLPCMPGMRDSHFDAVEGAAVVQVRRVHDVTRMPQVICEGQEPRRSPLHVMK